MKKLLTILAALCMALCASAKEIEKITVLVNQSETITAPFPVKSFAPSNSRVRADLERAAKAEGVRLFVPPLRLCGDNGAMVGAQAYYEYLAGRTAGSDLNAYASMELDRG